MIEKVLSFFDFPKSTIATKKLKTYFLEQLDLKANDKKLIKNFTSSITLHNILNQNKINISKYEDDGQKYVEIYLMSIELTDKSKLKQISNIIQTIPKPLILVFVFENEISINITPKRINKNDSTKLVYEETHFCDWINLSNPSTLQKEFLKSLTIANKSFINFYTFYNSYLDKIITLNASKYSGTLEINKNASEILAQITQTEQKINELKNKIKKETTLSDKVNMNIELKNLNDKLKNLKEDLK